MLAQAVGAIDRPEHLVVSLVCVGRDLEHKPFFDVNARMVVDERIKLGTSVQGDRVLVAPTVRVLLGRRNDKAAQAAHDVEVAERCSVRLHARNDVRGGRVCHRVDVLLIVARASDDCGDKRPVDRQAHADLVACFIHTECVAGVARARSDRDLRVTKVLVRTKRLGDLSPTVAVVAYRRVGR